MADLNYTELLTAIQQGEILTPIDPMRVLNFDSVNENFRQLVAETAVCKPYMVKPIYSIYKHLQLLDGDKYLALFKTYVSDALVPNHTIDNEFILYLVIVDILKCFDGVYMTCHDKFKRSFRVSAILDGCSDITVISPVQLNKVSFMLDGSTITNHFMEEKTVDGYAYKLTYDDGTLYMAFPEFINSYTQGYEICTEPVDAANLDVELSVSYKKVVCTVDVCNKYFKSAVSLMPMGNAVDMIGRNAACDVHYIYQYPDKIRMTADVMQDLGIEPKLITDVSATRQIKKTKKQLEGHHDMICIGDIKETLYGWEIITNCVTTDQILALDVVQQLGYTADSNFLMRNGVAVANITSKTGSNNILIQFDNAGCTVSQGNNTGNTSLALQFPLYVINGNFKMCGSTTENGFLYTMMNGDKLRFCRDGEYLRVWYNAVEVFTKHAATQSQLFMKDFPPPHCCKCVSHPAGTSVDLNWFLIDGKCYVFQCGEPGRPTTHLRIPVQYLETAMDILSSRGFSVML